MTFASHKQQHHCNLNGIHLQTKSYYLNVICKPQTTTSPKTNLKTKLNKVHKSNNNKATFNNTQIKQSKTNHGPMKHETQMANQKHAHRHSMTKQ